MRLIWGKVSHFVFAILCIVIVVTASYFSSLSAPFVWQDQTLIVNNEQIKHLEKWDELLTTTVQMDTVSQTFYRPLQMMTYMFDHMIWKDEPFGYHLTNLVLHCLAGVCLMELLWLLTLNRWTAFFGALLFVSHPIHTEAVAYVSGRSDPLAAIFTFLTIGNYIYSCKMKNAFKSSVYALLGLIFFAVALLAKEHAVIVPLLMVLYHVAYKTKIRWAAIMPYFLVAATYIGLRVTGVFVSAIQLDSLSGVTLPERLPGFFVALFSYIRLLILPINLQSHYGQETFDFGDSQSIAGMSIFILMVILFFKQRRDYPLMSFAIGWFLLALLPVSNLVPIQSYMAEHWLYIPSVGYFILFGMFFGFLYRRIKQKWFVEIMFGILLVFQIVLTVQQNRVWQDPVALYTRMLNHNPSMAKGHVNLGTAYLRDGDLEKALMHFGSAIKINPRYADAHNLLGEVYLRKGEYGKAYKSFLEAVNSRPQHLAGNTNVARMLVHEQRLDEAQITLEKVLLLDPDYVPALYELGRIHELMGRTQKAVRYYRQVLTLDPGHKESLQRLEALEEPIEPSPTPLP
ncbi:MAG: tetratricopeptide repeat protein [Candidatus Omnitrophica bacterium]|nr:tetratricopeptide repeat protein [Candidatus Omnitrophota bacterium]